MNRITEALCSELVNHYEGVGKTTPNNICDKILLRYREIRSCVYSCNKIVGQTNLTLPELSKETLTIW